MTLASEITTAESSGTGAALQFFFNFKCFSASHVKVYLDGVEQTLGFGVALNEDQEGSPGGSVTFEVAPDNGAAVLIKRRSPRTQPSNLVGLSALRAESLEQTLDKLVMQTQEVEQEGTGYTDEREAVIRADFNVLENAAATLASATASASAASASASAAAASEGAAAASELSAADWAARVRSALYVPPVPVVGATQARAIALRTVLYNRVYSTAGVRMWRSGGYGGWYFGELWYWMRQFPGLFDAVTLRGIIDHWATSYRPGQHDVAMFMSESDAFGYFEGTGVYPYDVPALFALTIAYAIERGDTTVWAAHGATALDCLAKYPRNVDGMLTIPDSATALGIGFEDACTFEGAVPAATGLFALAYQQLATFADPTLQATADSLIESLQTMRRADGYYNAAGNEMQASVLATALIAGHGLCSADEAMQTGNRLADDYLAGLISQRGAMRFLPAPNYWSNLRAGLAQGSFQNGGYVNGVWIWWACRAMIMAGRTAEAQAWMTEYVQELLRAHLGTSGQAPFEWYNDTQLLRGYSYYNTSGCALVGAVDPPAQDITILLPGAASSTVVVPVQAHKTAAVEVAAPSAVTATVAVSAAPRTHTSWDKFGTGYGTAVEFARLGLSSASSKQMPVVKSAAPYGGYLKAAITSGSSTQPLVVRLRQTPTRPPSLYANPASASDAFGSDTVSTYRRINPSNWAVTGGVMQKTYGTNGEVDTALYPMVWKDGTIEVDVRSSWANYNPGLVVRYLDELNYIWVRILPGSACQVVEVNDGISTVKTATGDNAVLNTWHHLKIVLSGTSMTVTSGATSTGYTVTSNVAGLSGLIHYGQFTGAAVQGEWDNLTITATPSAQRDWITDSEAIYTRTGVWTKSGGRLRTVDTAAGLSAIHPDFSASYLSVKATFTSADWANKQAGLCVGGTTGANVVFAVLDGTTVKAYGRVAGVDTLYGTGTLTTPLTNGVDATMILRAVPGTGVTGATIVIKVGNDVFALLRSGASVGSAGAFVRTVGGSAAEVSYASMRIDTLTTNPWQPIPAGYVLDAGDYYGAWITDDVYAGALGEVVTLRDVYGTPLQSVSGADDVFLVA